MARALSARWLKLRPAIAQRDDGAYRRFVTPLHQRQAPPVPGHSSGCILRRLRITVRAHTIVLIATTIVGLALVITDAASPTFWRVSTQQEFLKGHVENVSVDADGQLLLGPHTQVIYETTAPFLWTIVDGGDALWIGSGNDSKVFRVEPNGTATTVFEADALDVHAVAAAPAGGVYVGASPDGSLMRIAADGTSTTLFDPDEKYIWALAAAPNGTLFVATGDPGRIYEVDRAGNTMLFYDTKATHVLALAFDTRGHLLAGTGSPARVFRIERDGRAFVLLESEFEEIRSLHVTDDGAIYAVAVGALAGRPTPAAPPVSSTQPTPSVSVATKVTAVAPADVAGSAKGAVYRIGLDGVWDIVWSSNQDSPYDVAVDEQGGLVIGTGGDGKIFRVTDNPPKTILLTRAPAQQVTSLVTGPNNQLYYATANPGKLYRFSGERAVEGTYLSEARDANTIASWGTIRWRANTTGDGQVRLATRSGNTATPSETWSAWSEPYIDPTGTQITSPKARYLQWKAVLTGERDPPALMSVTAAYLPRNLRPEITSITIHSPGEVFQKSFSSGDPPIAGLDEAIDARAQANGRANGASPPTALGQKVYRKGLQTFVWNARDLNQDQLQFDVVYRSETVTTWRVLKRGLTDTIFTWDTTSAPDGTYVVRLEASDALANAPGTALRGWLDSAPFDIDNSAPVIELQPVRLNGGRATVAFTVTDAHSPIRHVGYSLDAERWQVLYPTDGIPDSKIEHFEVTIAAVAADNLVIRATDAMNNTVTMAAR